MDDGGLYSIKSTTMVDIGKVQTPDGELPVLRGWRSQGFCLDHPPIVYLGWKMEEWRYHYQGTYKIHYVLWKDVIYVMDNQFAKHLIPITEEFS